MAIYNRKKYEGKLYKLGAVVEGKKDAESKKRRFSRLWYVRMEKAGKKPKGKNIYAIYIRRKKRRR